jgi:hypothetical protein
MLRDELTHSLKQQNIGLHTEVLLRELYENTSGVDTGKSVIGLKSEGGENFSSFDCVIWAVGRSPNTKFLNLDRVLCLSAHPDDTEYGALGSMIKFKDTQFDVVVLSNGGDFDESSGFNREKECTEIWNKLSNVDGTFAHKTYVKDTSEDDWVNYIEQNYNIGAGMVESDYDCIITTPKEDSHFEHRMVNNIAYALVRASDCEL